MSQTRIQQKAVKRHLELISNLCIFGGLLFVVWGIAIYFLTGKSLEIWPLRFLLSLLFVIIGIITRKNKEMNLDTAEWILAAAGTVTVSYAFYVTWVAGLDPIWITGTTLIIIGVLNYLSGIKQAIAFAVFTLLVGAISMLDQNPGQLMAPNAVFFNFVTAIAIGFFSSLQRNRHLLDLIQLEIKQDIILSTMREGVVLHDASGVIISINDSAPKILGLTKDQILGKSNVDPQWKTFLEDGNPCPPEMHPSAVAQATGRPVENFLLKLQKVNGKISWLSISAMPTFEPGRSAPIATVVTIQDITDQKLKEEKIRSQEVSLMLASRLSGLGEMAAGIAHEINNPLAIISGRISILNQTLSDDKLDIEQFKKSLNSIEQTVFRIAKIVASMKSLSRQVSNDQFTKCSMMKILDDVVEISRERLREARISLIISDNLDLQFDCHPGLIGQAILNLTNNSVDAISKLDAKWIRISFTQEDTFLILRITDSGKGIPAELRAKILEPFFTTKEIGKGTGLGLSLVQTIVRSHYGEFYINGESQNTEFVLKLPMSQAVKNNA